MFCHVPVTATMTTSTTSTPSFFGGLNPSSSGIQQLLLPEGKMMSNHPHQHPVDWTTTSAGLRPTTTTTTTTMGSMISPLPISSSSSYMHASSLEDDDGVGVGGSLSSSSFLCPTPQRPTLPSGSHHRSLEDFISNAEQNANWLPPQSRPPTSRDDHQQLQHCCVGSGATPAAPAAEFHDDSQHGSNIGLDEDHYHRHHDDYQISLNGGGMVNASGSSSLMETNYVSTDTSTTMSSSSIFDPHPINPHNVSVVNQVSVQDRICSLSNMDLSTTDDLINMLRQVLSPHISSSSSSSFPPPPFWALPPLPPPSHSGLEEGNDMVVGGGGDNFEDVDHLGGGMVQLHDVSERSADDIISIHSRCSSPTSPDTSSSSSTTTKKLLWEQRYHELAEYAKIYGNTHVPRGGANGNHLLAQWVKRQRYQYKLRLDGKASTLNKERMDKLQRIGFVWSTREENWDDRFKDLVQYQLVQGHCNVPSKYPPNRQLSVWVRCQRRQYKLFVQQQKHKKKMTTSPQVNDAEPYDVVSGTNVSNNENKKKKTKAGQQRKHQQQELPSSGMTEERIIKLKSIGFEFNPRNLQL